MQRSGRVNHCAIRLLGLVCSCLLSLNGFSSTAAAQSTADGSPLPGTAPWQLDGELDEVMVEQIDRFALNALRDSVQSRDAIRRRDYPNAETYRKQQPLLREKFRELIGAVDERVLQTRIEVIASAVPADSGVIAEGVDANGQTTYSVLKVRWPVLQGVTAEGLLLQPKEEPIARVICLPDADWQPEQFVGLVPGVEPSARIPRRLAEQGFQVLVPTLINRDCTFSGHPDIRRTNMTHREFVYRLGFELGRHVIGFEVQKVQAAVDAFTRDNSADSKQQQTTADLPIGVIGVGEGGLLALYSAALDPRISAASVCGYFQRREAVWSEPIDRNVWKLLTEFGDAELALLISPRPLIICASAAPEVAGPPTAEKGIAEYAAPGTIVTPKFISVQEEFTRAEQLAAELKLPVQMTLVPSTSDEMEKVLRQFSKSLGNERDWRPAGGTQSTVSPDSLAAEFSPRQQRQIDELNAFCQVLLRRCAKVRDKLWSKADRSSTEAWVKSAEPYRQLVWEELIGKLPTPTIPPAPRSRKIFDEPEYSGYEVSLDVYPEVIAGGILLLPRGLKPNERRPVVVCQHGLEGRPIDTITTEGRKHRAYKSFSVELVKRGFLVYAPQNPYRGFDRFRTLQRKSNPLGRSLFSYIIAQHQQTLKWLQSLPVVDADRIGFYGLSYGGKTAMRVPPLLSEYALSICSGDFNEWVVKNASSEDRYSYIFTREYEIFEWNMAHLANYAELASLMAPRPFMVERGHDDGVAPDEWVAWEFAKVRRHYDRLGLGNKTEIEFFNGPHCINGEGTYRFLHRHLDWPMKQVSSPRYEVN